MLLLQMTLSVFLLLALLGLSSASLQDIVKKSSLHRKGIVLTETYIVCVTPHLWYKTMQAKATLKQMFCRKSVGSLV